MFKSLEQRVIELEEILGLDQIEPSEAFDFDVVPICNKLKELNLDYILNTPVPKLRRLKTTFSEVFLVMHFIVSLSSFVYIFVRF